MTLVILQWSISKLFIQLVAQSDHSWPMCLITDNSLFVAVRTSMLHTFVMGHGRGRAMKKQLQKVSPVYSYNVYNLGICKCASPKANQSSCQMCSWCIGVLKSPDLPNAQAHPQLWPCLKTLGPTWTTLWFHLLTLNNFPQSWPKSIQLQTVRKLWQVG